MVPREGFEPSIPCGRYHLKVVRMPVPPPGQNVYKYTDLPRICSQYDIIRGFATSSGGSVKSK